MKSRPPHSGPVPLLDFLQSPDVEWDRVEGNCCMRTCVSLAIGLTVASCSTLENIHDPQYGLLGDPSVLIKSIRCELITFYAANAARKRALDDIRNDLRRQKQYVIDIDAVLDHGYFDLDTDAYGAFVLESKTLDSAGLPGTATGLTDVLGSTTGHTKMLTTSPNVGSQGTYDMNYNFVIQQDDQITNVETAITEERVPQFPAASVVRRSTGCYRAVVIGRYDEMAQGKYPAIE